MSGLHLNMIVHADGFEFDISKPGTGQVKPVLLAAEDECIGSFHVPHIEPEDCFGWIEYLLTCGQATALEVLEPFRVPVLE